MKHTAISLAALIVSSLFFISFWPRSVLLINAQIHTMDEQGTVANSLLMRGRYITAVGSQQRLARRLPLFTKTIDMRGLSVLPGFIDAHSHFPSSGLALSGLDLTPPPVGSIGTLKQLLNKVSAWANHNPGDQWIIGFNYDDASLAERRHPTREELDKSVPSRPVYLWHRSGHMGVANTKALEELGYVDFTGAPNTVVPGAAHNSNSTGLLQESAAPRLSTLLSQLPYRRLLDAVLAARNQYLQAGVTTVQNGFADLASMRLLLWLQRLWLLPQRVIVWPAQEKLLDRLRLSETGKVGSNASEVLAKAIGWRAQSSRYSISALKLIADGSPQGRTAWLTVPYLADDSLPAGYRGFPHIREDVFEAMVVKYHSAGMQLALHGNGDASIDLIIKSLRSAQWHTPRENTRHLVVHAQTIRPGQITQLAELGAGVSFFPAHTYYWGDWYRNRVLGEKRAAQISPLALADAADLSYTLHSDAPVTPVDPLQILWSATQRMTLSGHVLGPSLAISRDRALRAMTIDAARQNFLEHDRGSLEVGKFADIIALSGNPMTEPDVRELRVDRVWIGGREVYQR